LPVVYDTPTPYGLIIVEDSTGEQLIVLFRDTDLSNAFETLLSLQRQHGTAKCLRCTEYPITLFHVP